MQRLHLFEFEDFTWFPQTIRNGGTDYLGFILNTIRYYKPVIPFLEKILERDDKKEILDLCSGNGQAILFCLKKTNYSLPIHVVLTDKFPNLWGAERIKNEVINEKIITNYLTEPTDIFKIKNNLVGIRTMFSAFHHFTPTENSNWLKKEVEYENSIAVFDSGDKNFFIMIGIVLFHPILFLICTPFIKPFKIKRIVFTYFLPLIPLFTIWDGVASILKLYSIKDMDEVTKKADPDKMYNWEIGQLKHQFGFRINYIIGSPKQKDKMTT